MRVADLGSVAPVGAAAGATTSSEGERDQWASILATTTAQSIPSNATTRPVSLTSTCRAG